MIGSRDSHVFSSSETKAAIKMSLSWPRLWNGQHGRPSRPLAHKEIRTPTTIFWMSIKKEKKKKQRENVMHLKAGRRRNISLRHPCGEKTQRVVRAPQCCRSVVWFGRVYRHSFALISLPAQHLRIRQQQQLGEWNRSCTSHSHRIKSNAAGGWGEWEEAKSLFGKIFERGKNTVRERERGNKVGGLIVEIKRCHLFTQEAIVVYDY